MLNPLSLLYPPYAIHCRIYVQRGFIEPSVVYTLPILLACNTSWSLYFIFNTITDAVKANGELVSRLEQHATADAAPGQKPRVHAQAQLDVPAEGVRAVVNDGVVSVDVAPTVPSVGEEVTPKVTHICLKCHKCDVIASARANEITVKETVDRHYYTSYIQL